MKHKVLTVKQPYSYLICSGIKPIENRTWKLPEKYKGQRVLIHASADRKTNLMALTREQYEDACDKFDFNGAMKPVDQWTRSALFDKPILNVRGKLSFWDFDLPEEYVKLLK